MRRTMARNLAEQLDWFADNREYAGKVDGQWPVLASRDSCTRSAALCGPMAGRGARRAIRRSGCVHRLDGHIRSTARAAAPLARRRSEFSCMGIGRRRRRDGRGSGVETR